MKMTKPPMIVTDDSLTVFLRGKALMASRGQQNYERALHCVRTADWEGLENTLCVSERIAKFTKGNVKVLGDLVTYKGELVGGVIAQRLVMFAEKGLDATALCRLLDNIMQNPNVEARGEFYEWLERGKMPTTEDGCFLAYRRVDKNYLSYHANPDGTHTRNRIGDVVKMKREDCDSNRRNECSYGLHFCSFTYLPQYYNGQGRVMVVKINPKNVISIPQDYNCAKGRCCEYEVVAEHLGKENTHALVKPLYDAKNRAPTPVVSWNKRDEKGHFISRKAWQLLRKKAAKAFKVKRDASGRFAAK